MAAAYFKGSFRMSYSGICITGPNDGELISSINAVMSVPIVEPLVKVRSMDVRRDKDQLIKQFDYRHLLVSEDCQLWIPYRWELKDLIKHLAKGYRSRKDFG